MLRLYVDPETVISWSQHPELLQEVARRLQKEFPNITVDASCGLILISVPEEREAEIVPQIEQRFHCKVADEDAWIP